MIEADSLHQQIVFIVNLAQVCVRNCKAGQVVSKSQTIKHYASNNYLGNR